MSVIFLDSSCRACKTPGLEEAVARINEELGEAVDGRADRWNVEFQAVGVAMDDRVGSGVEFLSGYGRFHQIVVGGRWRNVAIAEFIWRDGLAVPAVPQLLVLRRAMTVASGRGAGCEAGSARYHRLG